MNERSITEKKTGFDLVLKMVSGLCLGEKGRNLALEVSFCDDIVIIEKNLSRTEELVEILKFSDPFPADTYYNFDAEFQRIKIERTYLEPENLAELRTTLVITENIINYIKARKNTSPFLYNMVSAIEYNKEVVKKINRILNDKNEIRDDASPELKKIRSNISAIKHKTEGRLRQILQHLKDDNTVAHDTEITMRYGRCVIPVSASNKRRVKGYIHDESATGQTVFIEPSEIFEMNNLLRELENEEQKEIIKILILFTDFIRPQIPELSELLLFLAQIDFIRGRALFAIDTDSIKPKIQEDPHIEWIQAKNPLLYLHLRQRQKVIIPWDICLKKSQRIMVISGPNAGGKSVCLKTAGLLQYMLQCGFLIPVRQGSVSGIFKNIFIEIGDEQSIEEDLSTYSSHLKNLKILLENSDNKTLFLIDEFGSGTEPSLGGAIAEATLETLNNTGAFGLVTTHYANIKDMATLTEGFVNAAMQFDEINLRPLYKLKTGIPGNSFALEIAESSGYPKQIIEKAMEISGREKIIFEKQIRQFEKDKEELEKQKAQIRLADDFLAEIIEKYQKLLSETETKKEIILKNAREEAVVLIREANKTIENTIREIIESGAAKEQTHKARTELKKINAELITNINKTEKLKEDNTPKKQKGLNKMTEPKEKKHLMPEIGSLVKIPGQKNMGEIIDIKKDNAIVLYDNLRMSVPLSHLEVIDKRDYKKQEKILSGSNYSEFIHQLNDKIAAFHTTLDVRGVKAAEITDMVEKYIDDALLLKIYEVRILHGKGSGILRNIIHQYLSHHKQVESFANEHIDLGGDGITVIKLK